MFDINIFNLITSDESDTFTRFEISPLAKGFGHTLGNSIRRILMTSISGSAITAVKIKGVSHEYTTLDGLQEDILSLILNLKNVALKSYAEEATTLKLKVKGSGNVVEVKASDFEANSDVEIINPDLVLANITKDSFGLELEVTVESGIGYQLPDQSKRKEISVIPIDAVFSPVTHVKLDVKETRVGQRTDLDMVVLEVHTNGTRTPQEVFLEAVEIYDHIANRLVDLGGGDSKTNKLETIVEEEEVEETVSLPIYEIELSTRLRNSLINSNISDLTELTGRSRMEVMSFKGMGKKSFDELMELLETNGIILNN